MVTQLKRFLSYILATVLVVPLSLFMNFGATAHVLAANDQNINTIAASPVAQTTATLNGTNGDTAAETPTIIPESTTLEPTPAPTVATATATASIVTSEPAPAQSPSQWTFEKVELNKEYVAPQNSGVKLTFTKLPNPAGSIKIEEITLTPEQIQQTGSLSDKAYDITSDMVDGSFSYNLVLPIPESSKGKTVEVKFAEELSNIGTAGKVENTLTKTDTSVFIASLDHFTVFVVSSPALSGPACTTAGADTETGCYATIQEAVSAAAASGDTINVAAGTYNENLTIDKSLSLIGAGDTTLINGNINATGDNVTIQNLKITNSNVPGYGVKATAGKALTLENVTVDVAHDGVAMYDVSPTDITTITINNSRIRGYAVIYLFDPAYSPTDTNEDVNINVNNTSLTGIANDDGSGGNDFAVIGTDYIDDVHINFTGTSSVTNEYTVGAQAKEFLIWFYDAGGNSVTGSPTYTNGTNSKVNENALFVSSLNYTNTVAGQAVARYVSDTTEFEDALLSAATTPIVVGRGDPAITTTEDNTLNAGTTLIIESNNAPTTISVGTTLVNNGTIIIEPGATFINNGTIAITVTANAQSKERGAADPALTYTGASSLVNGDTFTGSLTRTAGEAIGTYPITQGTLSAGTHYAINYVSANLTISDTIAPTISSYTVSETIISPNNDGTKDSLSIDVAYSEQVDADINILDDLGVKVRDLYSASDVTNPTARDWNGKNNSNVVVADGVYTIQVIGTDSAGLTVTDISRTITVDNTAPVITLNGITPSIEIGGIYAELGATAVDAVDGSSTATPSGSVNTALFGSYTITYNATDSVGNQATPVTRTVNVVDTTPPTVTSVDSDSQTYKFTTSSPHTVTATFSENISNIPTIAVSGTGQTVTNCGDADAKTFCFAYAIPAATEYTTKTVQISGAQDIALNSMLVNNSHTFIVDTAKPLITVSGLISGTTLPTINIANAASYTLNGTYTELGAMSHFFWRVFDVTASPAVHTDVSRSTAVTGTDVPWSNTWTDFFNINFSGEGTFRIWSEVYDTAGNYGLLSYDGAYDLVAPTTPVINTVATDDIINAAERTATVTVIGTNESGSTVTLNGFATVVDTAITWHYVLTTGAIDAFLQGSETLTAIATDTAGNPNTVNGTRDIIVDTTAPVVTGVTDGQTYSVATPIEVSDALSGIATIKLNGQDFISDTEIFANGSYDLIATDNAGNVTEVKFVIDIAPVISGESSNSATASSVTITWTTDQPSTSRVVYDTASHAGADLSGYPTDGTSSYGYAHSTVITDTGLAKTKNHSITITGLTAGTTYYYRAVSSGSPETVGDEKSFSTQASASVSTSSTNQYSKTTYAKVAAIFSPDTTGSGTTSYTPVSSTTPMPSVTETNSPEVKGEQTENTKNNNLWLWIIIAIVLLGAGTGAYLYYGRNKETK